MQESTLWQKVAAESLGTGLLVLFGAGSVTATFTLIPSGRAPASEADFGIIGLAFAIIAAGATRLVDQLTGRRVGNRAVPPNASMISCLPGARA